MPLPPAGYITWCKHMGIPGGKQLHNGLLIGETGNTHGYTYGYTYGCTYGYTYVYTYG